ncbi:MAG: hypothetical protein WKF94_05375 [Solirubrobacteraceae bacterium]
MARDTTDLGSRTVEPKQKRKRKDTPSRRRRDARRGIERVATLRHEAWSQTGHPVEVTVGRLTVELGDLYDDKRRAATPGVREA